MKYSDTSGRYALLDELRGLDLVSMMLYHGCWDLVNLFGIQADWYYGLPGHLWQQSICWVFILLSGFCAQLGHHTLRRGAQVFGAGALVTAVTLLFMPDLLGFFLTGEKKSEYTETTTSMLYNPTTKDWDWQTIEALGLPKKIFTPLDRAGSLRGTLRPELAEEIEEEIPEFCYRLKMKAGLTGYAQVYGKYNTTSYDKLKLDLTYIRNYSLLLDLKLMLMTPKIMMLKESTEGVADNGNASDSRHPGV